DGEELPRMADAELEAGRLAARQPPHLADEFHHLGRRRKRRVTRRRDAVLAHRHAARQRDLAAHLGGREDAAVARLGALRELELHHLDLLVAGGGGELVGIERAVVVAAAEIAGADLPDDVAAHLAVIWAVAAFAGVVREVAAPGAAVERADGIRR